VSYTPPTGNAVELVLIGAYTAPNGNAVVLDFAPAAATQSDADITATLEDVSLVVTVAGCSQAAIAATLDDAVLVASLGHASLVSIEAALDDVVAIAQAATGVPVTVTATLDDCVVVAASDWSAGVWRGIGLSRQGPHADINQHVFRQTTLGFQQSAPTRAANQSVWQRGTPLGEAVEAEWTEVPRRRADKASGWDFVAPREKQTGNGYRASASKHHDRASVWQLGSPSGLTRTGSHGSPPRKALGQVYSYAEGVARYLNFLAEYGLATSTFRRYSVIPWEQGNPHSWIWGGWVYPPEPPVPPYVPSLNLIFYQQMENFIGGAILEFNYPCWAWPLINRNTYHYRGVTIVIHAINITRLPDLVNVPVMSVSLQFDIDSWAWGVSINLQTSQAMALLEPINGEPRQVRIEIDGVYITALIEAWSEQRQFGQTMYTATGRSVLALFSQPYAPIRSYLEVEQKTAAQLIDHELLNTGWSASYHADLAQLFTTDWLIPGGAWSYQNKSPIDAIVQIARSAGARAYADRNNNIVHIDPRYPVSPWNWATAQPNKMIPLSLARSIATQLTPQPDYNHIYVSGQTQGVIVSATRQGTAGDKPAPMITDSLITYVNAGRERARNSLANTGRQARVTLDLPLNETTGLIEPGQLIEVSDAIPWRGLVTGININAALGAISQRVEIERHYL
jgi:hypothetical protein